jgi:antitoxin VapB
MALNLENPKSDELARKLPQLLGKSITDVVTEALQEKLVREEGRRQTSLAEILLVIGKRCSALPGRDARSAEEILGFDEHGIPK